MVEALVVVVALLAAGVVVLSPLWGERPEAAVDGDREAAASRHQVALEALRDLEADRRAGLLDEAAYEDQRSDAEARAVGTRAALDRAAEAAPRSRPIGHRRLAAGAAAVIGALLVFGALLPATGIANGTVLNESLAAARAAERDRQARITTLREELAADPDDGETLSALADAHLAGASADDLARAAAALQLLIAIEPDRADAYERIVAAYLRAGDHANARAALDSYARRPTADPVELAFFDGLIALRGEGAPDRAVEAFDRFLELAPEDPRADMVRALRDEAAAAR